LSTPRIKQSLKKSSPVYIQKQPKKLKQPKQLKKPKQIPKLDREIYYTVLKGETLADIAKRYGYTEKEIGASNGIYPPYKIFPGETLVIPSNSPIILRGYNYEAIPIVIPRPPKGKRLKTKDK
jgi:LysM repeat protein